jgi:hypothetical protein
MKRRFRAERDQVHEASRRNVKQKKRFKSVAN